MIFPEALSCGPLAARDAATIICPLSGLMVAIVTMTAASAKASTRTINFLIDVPPYSGQQIEAMQSASIAARTANSAKVRANNINIALMAISHQQFVSLQSENLFHDGPLRW
jgi:hypothetical protein